MTVYVQRYDALHGYQVLRYRLYVLYFSINYYRRKIFLLRGFLLMQSRLYSVDTKACRSFDLTEQ